MFEVTDLEGRISSNTGANCLYMKKNSSNDWVYSGPVDIPSFNEAFVRMIQTYLSGVIAIQVDNKDDARYYGYTYVAKGVVLDPPPTIRSEVNIKEGTPHKDFKKRVAAGEILVSDYERATIRVKRKPGLRSTSVPSSVRCSIYSDVLEEAGLLERRVINGTPRLFFQGAMINRPVKFEIGTYTRMNSRTAPVWGYGVDVDAYTLLASARAFRPDVTSLVTSVLAKANKRSVDVLTAMAEMPKTIKSVLRGFKSVALMIGDMKRKKFSLSKAYDRRKKVMNDRYKARMARLQRELGRKNLSNSRRAALSAQVSRVEYTHRSALLKSADEFSKALGDLWMNYRYNIMTNVYLAQDVYDARYQLGRQFVTAAGTQRNQGSLPVGKQLVEASISSRVMIKRRFSQSAADDGFSAISNDIFTTAWELVPLSYVVDWFVNIGNLLAAQSYNVDWEAQGSTLGTKLSFDAEFGQDDAYKWTIEPLTVVSGSYYRREVINPHDHCGLVWKPTMGLERQIDALVLIWRPVRSLLLQSKRNR